MLAPKGRRKTWLLGQLTLALFCCQEAHLENDSLDADMVLLHCVLTAQACPYELLSKTYDLMQLGSKYLHLQPVL